MSDTTVQAYKLLGSEPEGFAIEFLLNTYAVRQPGDTPQDPGWTVIDDSQDPEWSETAV